MVLLGVATALAVHLVGGVEAPAVVGLLSGATTNTPSLAAAGQALEQTVADPGGPRGGGQASRASATR